MSEPVPPSWVCKRDGRLVPFEADRLSRALFAATESLGRPDALLARELADSVVYFLAKSHEGETPTTQRVAEVVEQTLRELGQLALAQAFRSGRAEKTSLAAARAAAARDCSLTSLYTRDLAAAQEDGLLVLHGQDAPAELAGCVLGGSLDVEAARRLVGQFVALDGLEHLAADGRSIADLAASICAALERTGLQAVVNLNLASAPSWADPLARGPLFADSRPDPQRLRELSWQLFVEFSRLQCSWVRIDWHLGADDFTAEGRARSTGVIDRAMHGEKIAFVFDRPRRPVALAEGLDRGHPAVLVQVGLNLPVLLRQPGMLADEDRYRQRLGSLVRLGLSAAVQKRDFVRQVDHRRVARGQTQTLAMSGFLLDRARLVLAPVGLDEVVGQFTNWSMASGGVSLEVARRLVQRLREVLDQEAKLAQMDACLDGLAGWSDTAERSAIAGLTPWDDRASVKSQLRAAGALHALAGHGTTCLFLEGSPEAEVGQWLEQAWRQTEVVRLRLVKPA